MFLNNLTWGSSDTWFFRVTRDIAVYTIFSYAVAGVNVGWLIRGYLERCSISVSLRIVIDKVFLDFLFELNLGGSERVSALLVHWMLRHLFHLVANDMRSLGQGFAEHIIVVMTVNVQ